MLCDKCATVKMEEGYMRVTVEYSKPESRSTICDTIYEVEKELDLFPEVIHRRTSDNSGTFSVEFGGSDDYVCTRTCGKFIEVLLAKLEITNCNCE
ncbi:MAG: hypothetical protein KAJ49_03100 [Arcobacteraceae bacterium]|nr:hypothetical protein [Arcobacteraceae bacterium]